MSTCDAIIPGEKGHRHEADIRNCNLTVSLDASTGSLEPVVEADEPDCLYHKRRFALTNIPLDIFSKAMAELARQDDRCADLISLVEAFAFGNQ